MSFTRLCIVTGLLLSGSLNLPAGDDKKQTDVKWAKRVAMNFLEVATGDAPAEAMGLLSPELARGLQANKDRANFLDMIPYRGYRDPKITGAETSPNGSEVVFSGVFKGSKTIPTPDADFTIWVTRESEQGKWSIRLVRVREKEPKPEK